MALSVIVHLCSQKNQCLNGIVVGASSMLLFLMLLLMQLAALQAGMAPPRMKKMHPAE